MLRHYVATSPAPVDLRHPVREDFERAGIRAVTEARLTTEALKSNGSHE